MFKINKEITELLIYLLNNLGTKRTIVKISKI